MPETKRLSIVNIVKIEIGKKISNMYMMKFYISLHSDVQF